MLISDTVLGRYAPDFELPGVTGQVHHLRYYLTCFALVGVVFLAHECPSVQRSLPYLKELQQQFQASGFMLIGINANDGVQSPIDRSPHMSAFADTWQLNFPYLRDETQDVAETFGVTHTPQMFLIDQEGVVQFNGGIDTQVEAAIAALLQQQIPPQPQTTITGTPLKLRR
ncbi:MAG: redoxin domain-containing protein [Cyanobacteria bacterium J06638_20]